MRVLVLAGAAAVLITELLSAFNLLRPIPLALAWLSTAVLWRRLSRNGGLAARPKWFEYPLLTGILLVLSIAAVVAAVSSPNTSAA